MLRITVTEARVWGGADPGGSKSISNRILVLKALAGADMTVRHLSASNDTAVLDTLLRENPFEWNVQDAGTAARFSAAYLATRAGEEHILTGTGRMPSRPMKPLLDALAYMGAGITYLGETGFLPVRIRGAKLTGGTFRLPHDVSSQFVSALAMVAPLCERGLVLEFDAAPLSAPYIGMTLSMLSEMYIHCEGEHAPDGSERIAVSRGTPSLPASYRVESDWSSASYWYAATALAEEGEVHLHGYLEDSLQGDSVTASLFDSLGVSTRFTEEGMVIKKTERPAMEDFDFDFSDHPDLAPTFAVVLPLLGIRARLAGLQTLRHKESNRVEVLVENLAALGIRAVASPDYAEMEIFPAGGTPVPDALIRCHGDHRMAMAFAPAVLKTGALRLDHPEVVEKSYPDFWKQFGLIFKSSILNVDYLNDSQ